MSPWYCRENGRYLTVVDLKLGNAQPNATSSSEDTTATARIKRVSSRWRHRSISPYHAGTMQINQADSGIEQGLCVLSDRALRGV